MNLCAANILCQNYSVLMNLPQIKPASDNIVLAITQIQITIRYDQ